MSITRNTPLLIPLPEDLTGGRINRFAIRSRLGIGGMGEVYYAEDTQLQRPVALKRVARHIGCEGRQHILKEAQRASALNSNHIAEVYDVVEECGELFLVMEYVDGVTLRGRLQIQKRVEIGEFFAIARQCVEALSEAHRKGILHHDIKPENIMLTPDGQVKILDFGLAMRLPSDDPTAATLSTQMQSRLCAGTPGYMAPEVLLERSIDARSDIFSLGVVFYEMLTGRQPFGFKKPIVTADHILHSQPTSMVELVENLPAKLEEIVFKMLAKDPKERYRNVEELLADLETAQQNAKRRRLLRGSVLARRWRKLAMRIGFALVVLTLALAAVPRFWPQKSDLPENKHLAVLPFVPASGDPEARAFCQGLTATLTSKLTQLTDRYRLQVVSVSDVRALPTLSVEQARVDLGVNLVLEGSFQHFGRGMRVSYNLVDARTHRVLRAGTIAANSADPFALEDRVVDSALHALDLELGTQERHILTAHGTSQPAAYDFYLRGRGYLQEYQRPENVDTAIQLFRRAVASDPQFALAQAALGESYWQKYELTHDAQWIGKTLEACERANAEGQGSTCLGVLHNGTGQYEAAAAEFQRALQVEPTNDDAYRGLAFAYEHLNKLVEAEQTYRRAVNVRPEYWAGYNWLGTFLYRQARYEEAMQMFAQATALAPDNARAHSNLGGVYLALGRYAEAISALQLSVGIHPSQDGYANLGAAYLYLRRFAEASQACEDAVKLDEGEYSVWGNLGDAYYWEPGRREQSKTAYRKAIGLGEERVRVNPRDASLLSYLAVFHAMLQEKSAAATGLNRALALAPRDPEVLFNAAVIASQLGDREETLTWMRKALEAGMPISRVRDSPNFDYLHSNSQFQQLLREKQPA